MSAHDTIRRAALIAAILAIPATAHAQDNRLHVNLTEAPEPDSVAWEDPARISLTIDPHGPDKFSAQVNLEVERQFSIGARPSSFGGNLVWNRETGGKDRQNNFEAGAFLSIGYDPTVLDAPHSGADPGQQDHFIAFAPRFSVNYARTAEYPDLSTAPCVATPAAPQCQTQFGESVRGSAALGIFSPGLEGQGAVAYSISVKAGVDYDHLINSPLDENGQEVTGGYLSALAGVAVSVVPRFDHRDFELSGSIQLRQRIFASASRRPLIESSALLFQASATYYLLTPTESSDWRAGIGITYTRGDDPLTGRSNVNRIVLALRVGRY
jgi:hypothetical protein